MFGIGTEILNGPFPSPGNQKRLREKVGNTCRSVEESRAGEKACFF